MALLISKTSIALVMASSSGAGGRGDSLAAEQLPEHNIVSQLGRSFGCIEVE